MKYTVRSDSAQSLNLCEENRINSILQSLYLLLTTRQGTVPMYRDFGLPMNFVDKPVTVVETLIASEIREAMEKSLIINLSIPTVKAYLRSLLRRMKKLPDTRCSLRSLTDCFYRG